MLPEYYHFIDSNKYEYWSFPLMFIQDKSNQKYVIKTKEIIVKEINAIITFHIKYTDQFIIEAFIKLPQDEYKCVSYHFKVCHSYKNVQPQMFHETDSSQDNDFIYFKSKIDFAYNTVKEPGFRSFVPCDFDDNVRIFFDISYCYDNISMKSFDKDDIYIPDRYLPFLDEGDEEEDYIVLKGELNNEEINVSIHKWRKHCEYIYNVLEEDPLCKEIIFRNLDLYILKLVDEFFTTGKIKVFRQEEIGVDLFSFADEFGCAYLLAYAEYRLFEPYIYYTKEVSVEQLPWEEYYNNIYSIKKLDNKISLYKANLSHNFKTWKPDVCEEIRGIPYIV